MERKPSLSGDLAVLAEEKRSRLGEPPDAELLIAFHEGELPEEEMDRVRDWLAVDPDWASIYLDLKRGGLGAGGVASAGLGAPGAEDPEVDAAWRALVPKLRREAAAAEVVPFPRRRIGRTLLALAAVLLVIVALVWLLVSRGEPGLPKGEYYAVAVKDEGFRGLRISIPPGYVGVELQIGVEELSGTIVLELRDSSNRRVQRQSAVIEPGMDEVGFRVASSSLRDGGSYTLSARQEGAKLNDPPLMTETLRFSFTE